MHLQWLPALACTYNHPLIAHLPYPIILDASSTYQNILAAEVYYHQIYLFLAAAGDRFNFTLQVSTLSLNIFILSFQDDLFYTVNPWIHLGKNTSASPGIHFVYIPQTHTGVYN